MQLEGLIKDKTVIYMALSIKNNTGMNIIL